MARTDQRKASSARFMAFATSIGSSASAMALFIKIPSQPSYIAMVASEAVRIPVSTIIGTLVCPMTKRIIIEVWIAWPDPIGAHSIRC